MSISEEKKTTKASCSSVKGDTYNVMFLCNHNSCRSQMAEGWARNILKREKKETRVGVASAGIAHGTSIREGAITVMKEVGIDITNQTSDGIDEYSSKNFTHVVAMCGCTKKLTGEKSSWRQRSFWADWNLDDPPKIDKGDLEEYRRVRDECKDRVGKLLNDIFERLESDGPSASSPITK